MFASNPRQVFRQLNNENPVASAKTSNIGLGSTSKTPASSKQRRALGDISNRKQGKTNGGLVPQKTQGVRLQPQRNPLSTKTSGLSKKKEVTFLPRPTQAKQASTVKFLSDRGENKSITKHPVQKSLLKNKLKTSVNVDDIERPAGRLWIDEPDDYSVGSVSLPEINWGASYKKQQELRVKWTKEEQEREDAAYDEYIKKALEDDGKCNFEQ